MHNTFSEFCISSVYTKEKQYCKEVMEIVLSLHMIVLINTKRHLHMVYKTNFYSAHWTSNNNQDIGSFPPTKN